MPFSSCSAGGGSTRCPATAQHGSLCLAQFKLSVPLPEMHLPSKKLYFGTLPGQWFVFQVCSRLKAPARAVNPPPRTTGTSDKAFCSAADGNQPLVLPATAAHDRLISSTSSAWTHQTGGYFKASSTEHERVAPAGPQHWAERGAKAARAPLPSPAGSLRGEAESLFY